MKQLAISAVVAAIVAVIVLAIGDRLEGDDETPIASAPESGAASQPSAAELAERLSLSVTVEPTEDSWLAGSRGFGADERILSDADHSICFLTKIQIGGISAPEDTGTCRIEVDDFTGFWKVVADVPEGSRSEIRCNARCLVWE